MQHRLYWFATLTAALAAFISTPAAVHAADLFNNTNTLTVNDCPQPVVNCAPQFVLGAPATIDTIQTYHRQTPPSAAKTLGLADASGTVVIQPRPVTIQPASPGFENWVASIGGQQVPAGTYRVIDSQADTWAQNSRSCDAPGVAGGGCNKGFALVLGNLAPPGGAASTSVTDCTATCNVPPALNGRPIFACSAHGPRSTCRRDPASGQNPGGGVMCTDGRNTTRCNCQLGCTTQ